MKTRRVVGALLIAAGVGLCAAAGLHDLRGAVAQRGTIRARGFSAGLAKNPARAFGESEHHRGLSPPGAEAYPYGRALACLRIPSAEKARLTLITCYRFSFIGPAPERLVMIAEPAPPRHVRHSS